MRVPLAQAHGNYKYFSGQNLGYILGGLSVIGRRDKLRHHNRLTAAGLDKSGTLIDYMEVGVMRALKHQLRDLHSSLAI